MVSTGFNRKMVPIAAAAGVILLILVSGLPVSWLWAADGLLALTAAALSVLGVGIGMKKWHEMLFLYGEDCTKSEPQTE